MGTEAEQPLRIAVVGCGVAGLTAAWLLQRRHEVTLFEKNPRLGGHSRTVTLPSGPDAGTPVDTGFIVMNERNYPLFTRVLRQLDVATAASSMTFSFEDRANGYAYAGNGLRTLFPTPAHLARPAHLSLLRDMFRFARRGYRDLCSGFAEGHTLGDYLRIRRFGRPFRDNYLFPMGAAIWSAPTERVEAFPAQAYLRFFENHGLLRLTNRPRWRYISGGSRTYVDAMRRTFRHPPETASPPRAIRRTPDGVALAAADGSERAFDHVVIGTHADEALNLLADPSPDERRDLGAWRYNANEVVLHTDTTRLPRQRKLWASWNFVRSPGDARDRPVAVSYHMNRLQNLATRRDYLVTLNPGEPMPDKSVIDRTVLTHPEFSFGSLASQPRLRANNGRRNTWFCGSYFGYGFHEDAVRSAVDVAEAFGIRL